MCTIIDRRNFWYFVGLCPLTFLSVSVSPSLLVSCALYEGSGLRHTFHLAYEALILFRAWSERKMGGDVDVGGGWVE